MEGMGPVRYKEFSAGDKTFRVPESGYAFNNTDCWARVKGNIAAVGFSDIIRFDPRELLSLRPPDVGDEVHLFEKLCSFKTDQISLDVTSPVSGIVLSVNKELLDNPGLVKEDPYEHGWIVEMELFNFDDDMDCLMDCQEYPRFARARIEMGPQVGCPCSRLGPRKSPK